MNKSFNFLLVQVCLPEAASKYVGDKATVIGWGRTAHGQSKTPDKLQEVEVEVISQETCQVMLPLDIHSK